MSELSAKLLAGFAGHYGASPKYVIKAPGRVNLIGEHTDYNDGFVMPCAVEYHTLVGISPRDDFQVETLALDWQDETDGFSLQDEIAFHQGQMWSNYIRGVVSEMQRRNYSLRGCNIAVTGNVPQGAGLSSSAALEVGVVRAIAEVSGLSLEPAEMAAIGQAAENNFVGCACGIMDQLISAAGKEGYALGIDCRSLALTPLPIPESLSLLIVNSNVKRGLVDSEYNVRRQQCEAAAAYFGHDSLRDVSLEVFQNGRDQLDPVVSKRAQHVLEENQRVLAMQDAFRSDDIPSISRLMAESHRSMRDLFEITTGEIDFLVDRIAAVLGERGGARMTGGGIGGCIVSLLPASLIDDVRSEIAHAYHLQTGLRETVYCTAPADGVALIQ
jgi:galactokinase